MATRMQQRRGTEAQWESANPVLAAGEIGFETDTNKFKIGDGINLWEDLSYFLDTSDLQGSFEDYVPLTQKGSANGVAELDANGQIPVSQLGNLIADAPALLDTLEEIAAALGDDPDFISKVVPIVKKTTTDWEADTSAISAGTIAYDTTTARFKVGNGTDTWSTTSYILTAIEVYGSVDAAVAALGEDILEDSEFTGTVILPATTSIGEVTSTEIGYLQNVTSGIQGQINSLQGELDAAEGLVDDLGNTKADLASPTFTGDVVLPTTTSIGDVSSDEIGYLNGVTSGIQGQLDNKADDATVSTTYATLEGPTFTGTVVLPSTTSIGTVGSTELGYLNGVTSNVQDQIDAKAPSADPTFTGTVSGITSAMVGLGNVENTSDADKPVSTATQTALDAKLSLSGGTMTGRVTLSADPTQALHAVTKQYVDGIESGLKSKPSVRAATTTNLSAIYDNGTAGVGATLTADSDRAFTALDGVTSWAITSPPMGVLVKNQTNPEENGRYNLTTLGSSTEPWVLTRCGLCDEASEIPGAYVFVQDGTVNEGTGWVQIVDDPDTFEVGTDAITVTQFSGPGSVTAGDNISVVGSQVSVISNPTFANVVTASSGVAFSDGTQTKQGVPSITTIAAKTDSYTLSNLNERDTIVEISKASAVTLTIPTNASVAYPVGTTVDIIQTGSGQVTIAGAGGVTVNATPGLKLRTQWSSATLLKRAENTWLVYGDLTA
jgi:hypothetical protein